MLDEATARQIRNGEGLHTEFSRTLDAGHVAKTIGAFLNSGGGTVFCGVDARGRPLGVDAAPAALAKLESELQAAISPTALFTLSTDSLDGAPIVVVEVPEGKDTPYVVGGAVYVRRGERTLAADARALRELVRDRVAGGERWERRPAPGVEIDDLEPDEIRAIVRDARQSARFEFGNPDRPEAVLTDLSMTTVTGVTHAAEVAFARNPSRRLPQCRLRLVRFRSDKAGELFEDDRWFDGPLVRIFEQAFDALASQVRVRSYFRPGEARREDRPQYSLEALREGLVNAVAHRDYSAFSGGVTISVFPGRIEIWNSGRLPAELGIDDLRRTHPSIPTNPDISRVLYLRRLMERIGRGTQKIILASKELGARPPRWVDRPSGVTLTIFAAVGEAPAVVLNERQRELLRALRPGEAIQSTSYAERIAGRVSERQARRDLATLESAGFLVREGDARASRYMRTGVEPGE